MPLTSSQANELLRNNPGDYSTVEQLRNLIAEIDTTGSGTQTTLYSGPIGGDLNSSGVAQALAAS